MGGTVKLRFQCSVDLHKTFTFLNKHAELFCHVAYTVTVRVAVEFGFTVGVMPLSV